jgi:endonuclease G, mitochondrial
MKQVLLAGALAFIGSVSTAQEIHIVHCFEGACPSGTPETNDLIVREVYALSSNEETKLADWVAYRVTRETIGTSADLNRGWETDEFLDEDETLEAGSGRRDDYHGANSANDYDRGHQAPLASFAGTVFWRTTNIYSNITPQRADLNQGAWVALEDAVRDLAFAQREVWVLTGPLYEREMPELGNAGEEHVVPSGYWKVIVNEYGHASAFFFDQATPRDADYCDHRTTLADIETRSGLSLVPGAIINVGELDHILGCAAQT